MEGVNDPEDPPSKRKKRTRTSRNDMNPKETVFVKEYLGTANAAEAARRAGYSARNARHEAHKIKERPLVKAAIAEARKEVIEKGKYGLERAMQESQSAMEFAIQTENANAYVKAIELRSKLQGLLVEKHDIRQVGFSIIIGGIDEPDLVQSVSSEIEHEVPQSVDDSELSELTKEGES